MRTERTVELVVVGAHLRGQPLNHQLTDLGATFERSTRTAPLYALYALSGAVRKPGMIRVDAPRGRPFHVEVWRMPLARFGEFMIQVPSPLSIGTVSLEGNHVALGFLCEPYAIETAEDISHFDGWLAYLASLEVTDAR